MGGHDAVEKGKKEKNANMSPIPFYHCFNNRRQPAKNSKKKVSREAKENAAFGAKCIQTSFSETPNKSIEQFVAVDI